MRVYFRTFSVIIKLQHGKILAILSSHREVESAGKKNIVTIKVLKVRDNFSNMKHEALTFNYFFTAIKQPDVTQSDRFELFSAVISPLSRSRFH